MSLPYKIAASGEKAIGEIQKMLHAVGYQRFSAGEVYENGELFI